MLNWALEFVMLELLAPLVPLALLLAVCAAAAAAATAWLEVVYVLLRRSAPLRAGATR